MNFIKNDEVGKCLDIIINNINEYLISSRGQYNYQKAKAEIVKELSNNILN